MWSAFLLWAQRRNFPVAAVQILNGNLQRISSSGCSSNVKHKEAEEKIKFADIRNMIHLDTFDSVLQCIHLQITAYLLQQFAWGYPFGWQLGTLPLGFRKNPPELSGMMQRSCSFGTCWSCVCVSLWGFVHLLRNKSHQVNPWKFRRKGILPASPLVAAMAHCVDRCCILCWLFFCFSKLLRRLKALRSSFSYFFLLAFFCIILEVCGSGSLWAVVPGCVAQVCSEATCSSSKYKLRTKWIKMMSKKKWWYSQDDLLFVLMVEKCSMKQ